MLDDSIIDTLNKLGEEQLKALKYLDEEQTKRFDSVPATDIMKSASYGMKTLVTLQEIEAKTGLVKSVIRYPMRAGNEELNDDGRFVDYNPNDGHLRYSIPDGDVRLWLRNN